MAFAMQSTLMGAKMAAPARSQAKPARSAVVCTASAEDARRAVVSFGAAASVALSMVGASFAEGANGLVGPPTLVDDTKRNAGVQLIYEARDLDIDAKPRSDQATRFAFQKLTVAETKTRAGESLTRVLGSVADYSNKKYWTQAQNELRRQIGTLRFDLDNLVQAKGSGVAEVDTLNKSLEKLDFAFRKKSPEMAAAALTAVKDNVATVKALLF